jgi:hypothetical protein
MPNLVQVIRNRVESHGRTDDERSSEYLTLRCTDLESLSGGTPIRGPHLSVTQSRGGHKWKVTNRVSRTDDERSSVSTQLPYTPDAALTLTRETYARGPY